VLAAVLLCTGVAACETEAVGGPTSTLPTSFTATVDGAPWTANANVGLGTAIGQVSASGQEVLVLGADISNATQARQITLRLNAFNGVGTYALGTGATGAAERTGPSYAFLTLFVPTQQRPVAEYETATGANAGTATVTSWDAATRRIAGTFSFTGQASTPDSLVRITAGQFEGRLSVAQ
jgi:hypothetical protein